MQKLNLDFKIQKTQNVTKIQKLPRHNNFKTCSVGQPGKDLGDKGTQILLIPGGKDLFAQFLLLCQ